MDSDLSGWSPAVRGGWSIKHRKAEDYLPLTDEVIASHLRGDATSGIYPLLRGDTCTLLACDFDDGFWALDALAFMDRCHDAGVPAVLERSRSGDGAHVWVFFTQPVPATAARAMGSRGPPTRSRRHRRGPRAPHSGGRRQPRPLLDRRTRQTPSRRLGLGPSRHDH